MYQLSPIFFLGSLCGHGRILPAGTYPSHNSKRPLGIRILLPRIVYLVHTAQRRDISISLMPGLHLEPLINVQDSLQRVLR